VDHHFFPDMRSTSRSPPPINNVVGLMLASMLLMDVPTNCPVAGLYSCVWPVAGLVV